MSPFGATATSVGFVKSNLAEVADSFSTLPIWYRILPFMSVLYTRAPIFGAPLGVLTFSVQYRNSSFPSLLQYRPCAVSATCCGVKPTPSEKSLLQVSRSLPSLSKIATQGLVEREVTKMRSWESTTSAQPKP